MSNRNSYLIDDISEESDDSMQELDDLFEDEAIDEEMAEAEKRLSKAAYYKVIVKNGVIEDDGTAEASEINAEARLWARRMMVSLLKGGFQEERSPETPFPFNDKEVLALKKVAEKVLASQGEKPVDPVVKKVQMQPTPVVKRVKPQQPVASSDREKKEAPKKRPKKVVDYSAIPLGEVFQEKDRKYKFVAHPTELDEKGEPRRVKLDVTGQVQTPQAARMPTAQQLTTISHMQSLEQVNNPMTSAIEQNDSDNNNLMALALRNAIQG